MEDIGHQGRLQEVKRLGAMKQARPHTRASMLLRLTSLKIEHASLLPCVYFSPRLYIYIALIIARLRNQRVSLIRRATQSRFTTLKLLLGFKNTPKKLGS